MGQTRTFPKFKCFGVLLTNEMDELMDLLCMRHNSQNEIFKKISNNDEVGHCYYVNMFINLITSVSLK